MPKLLVEVAATRGLSIHMQEVALCHHPGVFLSSPRTSSTPPPPTPKVCPLSLLRGTSLSFPRCPLTPCPNTLCPLRPTPPSPPPGGSSHAPHTPRSAAAAEARAGARVPTRSP